MTTTLTEFTERYTKNDIRKNKIYNAMYTIRATFRIEHEVSCYEIIKMVKQRLGAHKDQGYNVDFTYSYRSSNVFTVCVTKTIEADKPSLIMEENTITAVVKSEIGGSDTVKDIITNIVTENEKQCKAEKDKERSILIGSKLANTMRLHLEKEASSNIKYDERLKALKDEHAKETKNMYENQRDEVIEWIKKQEGYNDTVLETVLSELDKKVMIDRGFGFRLF